MSKHSLEQLSLDVIVPSRDNARRIDQKSVGFQELVKSISAGGVQIPIHVWPHPTKKGKYEIRAGERRWRACKSLKHRTIPAVVHRGISYQVAMALTYTENKFREDLRPLEEVAEIARGMEILKYDAKLIATLLGQTEQWVRLRANIHRNLTPAWRDAFPNMTRHPHFKNWSVGHLTFIARLPANSQKELLANITNYSWQWENVSVGDLEKRLGQYLHLLIKAKWNLDDETILPKAGACSKCVKRSGAEPLLWFGATGNQIKSKDRCLDPQCWKNKMKLYLQQQAKRLSEEHSNLAYVSADHLKGDDKEDLSKTFGRVLGPFDVQKSTKGSKGSIPALIVHGDGTGTVTYIKEKQFARPAGARSPGKPKPLKQRREMLNAKRWAQVLLELRDKVEAAGIDRVFYKDKITGVMALAAIYGNQSIYLAMVESKKSKEVDKLVKAGNRKMALAYLWASVKPTFDNLLICGGPVTQTPERYVLNARWIAKLVQVDIEKMFKEVSKQKGFTEPKSWKGLKADGTTKAAKKAKKKKPA